MATTRMLLSRTMFTTCRYGFSSGCSKNLSSWMRDCEVEHKQKKSSSSSSPLMMMRRREKMSSPKAAVQISSPLVTYTNNETVLDVGTIWANLVAAVVSVSRLAQITKPSPSQVQLIIEKGLIDCRFFTLFAVAGSLVGSILCYVEGCSMIFKSYLQYFYAMTRRLDAGYVVPLLVEAIDMFLVGTAMFIFGMALYVMFVGSKNEERSEPQLSQSNCFGLFRLKTMPSWAEPESMSQAKSRIGHAVMMVLQVGVLEKFKNVPLVTALDLACFAGALLVSSASIFVLSKLYKSKLNKLRNS